eukprot:4133651-Amphidinium_carterae.1
MHPESPWYVLVVASACCAVDLKHSASSIESLHTLADQGIPDLTFLHHWYGLSTISTTRTLACIT